MVCPLKKIRRRTTKHSSDVNLFEIEQDVLQVFTNSYAQCKSLRSQHADPSLRVGSVGDSQIRDAKRFCCAKFLNSSK